MSYTDDAVLSKLSALNETQESIVTVAQWVMFHRRHADRTGQLWFQRLKDSNSSKRLNLIYLANEVAQQSKARKKDDFLTAFSPIIADATSTAYKGATSEVQQKLRRVVEVWRQRAIFEGSIQEAIESRLDDLDKNRSSGKRGLADGGGSIFVKSSGSTPLELTPLVAPQQNLTKLLSSTRTSTSAASVEYERLTGPDAITPSAPVHAARLNGLLKTLANAEGAVAESIKARQVLVAELEKILDTNRTALATEEAQLAELSSRRTAIDTKKREVEDSIMRGFASTHSPITPGAEGTPGSNASPMTPAEPDRPEVEALTPPPVEAFTPPAESSAEAVQHSTFPTSVKSPSNPPMSASPPPPSTAGLDLLASLSAGVYGQAGLDGQLPGSLNNKKRKMSSADDFPDLGGDAMDGIDDDVVAMLKADTQ